MRYYPMHEYPDCFPDVIAAAIDQFCGHKKPDRSVAYDAHIVRALAEVLAELLGSHDPAEETRLRAYFDDCVSDHLEYKREDMAGEETQTKSPDDSDVPTERSGTAQPKED